MLRRTTCFSAAASASLLGGSSESLVQSYNNMQSVWSLDWKGQPLTTELKEAVQKPDQSAYPMFHVLTGDGNIAAGAEKAIGTDLDSFAPRELCEKMITTMVKQHAMDDVLLDSQRQGRISFYMTGFQEEASVTGSAAAFKDDDYIFMQYREAALMTYRGYSISERIAQCMGNVEDPAKGRQMPIHYGSVKLHAQTVSSPLTTQVPHAAGAGYAFRLENNGRLSVVYFGEGAASEGDFHAGLNFAATRNAATMFFCRNNGYAISTPTHDQYKGDGILLRGVAYGMPSYRVDGHDALAVLHATRVARSRVFEGKGTPVLVESMAYRGGHHSTSDDSTAYRKKDEITKMHDLFDPIARFEKYLVNRGWWSKDQTEELSVATKKEVLDELNRQEHLPFWPISDLFTDTTEIPHPRLLEQKRQVETHTQKYKEDYGHLVN